MTQIDEPDKLQELFENYHIVKYDNIDGYTRLGDSESDWHELYTSIKALIATQINQASEVFIPVKGYEGLYEVSNLGNIRSLSRGRNTGRNLRQAKRYRNYLVVSLCKNGKVKSASVHRVVAEAFLSNPENKRTVNHIDSNPLNNNVSNLEWATHSENERHAHRNGKKPWNKGRMGLKANVPRIVELRGNK